MPRLGKYLTNSDWLNAYARKSFSRLEWPGLRHRVAAALDGKDDHGARLYKDMLEQTLLFPIITSNIMKGDERSPEAQLLRFFAGRWAAKEAAIKAHSRRLNFQDIHVLGGGDDAFAPANPGQFKPLLLVDPPRNIVWIREDIAGHRGLRGYNDMTKFSAPSACYYGRIENGVFVQERTDDAKKFFKRQTKIEDEDRQCAELSITHDGEYAIAVCMACTEQFDSKDQKPALVDDGSGNPLHDPQWGDEGFLSFTSKEPEI